MGSSWGRRWSVRTGLSGQTFELLEECPEPAEGVCASRSRQDQTRLTPSSHLATLLPRNANSGEVVHISSLALLKVRFFLCLCSPLVHKGSPTDQLTLDFM